MSFRGHHPRTTFASGRRDPVARGRARAGWIAVLDRAVELGEHAVAGGEIARLDASAFAGAVIRAGEAGFPLPYVSAEAAAAGFRHLARGFVAAAQPELRRALGRALAEAARACRLMLQIEDDQAAAAWRRRLAED